MENDWNETLPLFSFHFALKYFTGHFHFVYVLYKLLFHIMTPAFDLTTKIKFIYLLKF